MVSSVIAIKRSEKRLKYAGARIENICVDVDELTLAASAKDDGD
jgi:hypothetical protein